MDGAKQAIGLTVVIDVFRAFTTDAYVLANGALCIFPVKTVEEAIKLKEQHPSWILMGERGGKKIPSFDYGNSPYIVKNVDFNGCKVIQTTSAGTQGLLNSYHAEEILPGSFVIADAIVNYIKMKDPKIVSIVAMGWEGKEMTPEDESLAEYIELKLKGEEPDFHSMKKRIRTHPQGAKFFDPMQSLFREGDFHCALDINRFNFCLKLVKSAQPYIIKF